MSATGITVVWQENVDRRVLSAFVCVDALTGSTITRPMRVTATVAAWKVKPNRSAIYVVFDGPGLDPQTNQFIPVGTWPTAVSFEVTLQDGQQQYQSRRVQVKAPATVPAIGASPGGAVPNPAAVAALNNSATIFSPQQITMYPNAAAVTGTNWGVIRASVTNAATGQGLPWAILRVTRQSDGTVMGTGQTDQNGEALLALIGLTTTTNTSGTGPVTVSTTAVTVEAIFDPSVLTQPSGWIANPDDILSNVANPAYKTGSQSLQIASGQEFALSFALSL
jgi:hypothetical protein